MTSVATAVSAPPHATKTIAMLLRGVKAHYAVSQMADKPLFEIKERFIQLRQALSRRYMCLGDDFPDLLASINQAGQLQNFLGLAEIHDKGDFFKAVRKFSVPHCLTGKNMVLTDGSEDEMLCLRAFFLETKAKNLL